jgi:hypothetical protein
MGPLKLLAPFDESIRDARFCVHRECAAIRPAALERSLKGALEQLLEK